MSNAPSYPQTFFQPDPGACQIVLARHGQSEAYVPGSPFPLVAGQGDPPLSERGRWQAQRLADRLADEPVSAVYASTLTRTQQTAAPLAERLGLEIRIEADLREVHLGIGEGGEFRRMAAEGHPHIERMRELRDWGAVPEAETNADLAARTGAAIRSIAARHADELVLAVCHGGVIAALAALATSAHPFDFHGARNASVSLIVVHPERWVLRSFNDAAHVGPLTADADPPS